MTAAEKRARDEIARQVQVQVAAELVLRRYQGSHGAEGGIMSMSQLPSSAPDLSLILQQMGIGGAPAKKKVTKYNRLVGKHMRALSKARNWKNKAAKVRFKRAVALARKELKSGKKNSK